MRIFVITLLLVIAAPASIAAAQWNDIVARAKGQTVYWNAWAGDEHINAYIDWAGDEVEKRYGIAVQHVKLSDTAEAVSRVLAEQAAGRDQGGSVDLVWINGENFVAMKRNGLLFGPWTQWLPNYQFVDTTNKPTTTVDFTVPVDGLEAPWGMAQLVFAYDTAQSSETPTSIPALLAWAKAHPGRFTYPQPPNFLGSTFLKQALSELLPDPNRLQQPATDADFADLVAPLWAYLDELHPVLWRSGKIFPANGPAQRRLLGDGEIDIALSFHPPETSAAIQNGELPDTVRTFVLSGGTIGNTHFLAVPYNAEHKEGAMVLANFLLSPEAQAHKQDPRHWGDFTVLDLTKLPPAERQRFDTIPLGVATLSPTELGTTLQEPHPSWMERIEAQWQQRYAN